MTPASLHSTAPCDLMVSERGGLIGLIKFPFGRVIDVGAVLYYAQLSWGAQPETPAVILLQVPAVPWCPLHWL